MTNAKSGCGAERDRTAANVRALVCFAVKEEIGCSLTHAANCKLLVTGMGRHNATDAVRAELDSATHRLVLTCGFAGGLNPDLDAGTVMFSEVEETGLAERLLQWGAVRGRFHCAERVAITSADKRALWNATGADAVEMESAFIHAICGERNIPCATVRVILDPAGEDLPLDFNALMTPRQRIHYPKLIGTILARPGRILPLLRFQREARLAAERLGAVLNGLLAQSE
jgi:adenosylhomocysteine nucleosidase